MINFVVYYISKDRQISYISQVINDIRKLTKNKNVIIFIEDMKILSEKQKFVFANESTIIINATKENLKLLKQIENIDFYTILQSNFKKDLLLSSWKKQNI